MTSSWGPLASAPRCSREKGGAVLLCMQSALGRDCADGARQSCAVSVCGERGTIRQEPKGERGECSVKGLSEVMSSARRDGEESMYSGIGAALPQRWTEDECIRLGSCAMRAELEGWTHEGHWTAVQYGVRIAYASKGEAVNVELRPIAGGNGLLGIARAHTLLTKGQR